MKSCELCKSPARIYCESDQASLCWTCDSKVHSANFLVARHSRALLCRVCQSLTPWTASGEKLGPSAVSFCVMCVGDTASDDDDDDEDDDGLQELINDDDDDESVEEDGENQVVPLLLCSTPPPPVASSSSSGSECGDDDLCVSDPSSLVSVKRKRVNAVDISSSEDDICSETKYLNENRKKATLYQFLPTSAEEMGEKLGRKKDHRSDLSGKDKDGEVGVCKGTRTVGLDLNAD